MRSNGGGRRIDVTFHVWLDYQLIYVGKTMEGTLLKENDGLKWAEISRRAGQYTVHSLVIMQDWNF